MSNSLTTRIILRNDSATNWLANENQVLLKGEVGIEFLANGKVKMKIGDGEHRYNDLPFLSAESGTISTEQIKIKIGENGEILEADSNNIITIPESIIEDISTEVTSGLNAKIDELETQQQQIVLVHKLRDSLHTNDYYKHLYYHQSLNLILIF